MESVLKDWDLPPVIKHRLGREQKGRQRVLAHENHLLIVTHKPPGPSDIHRETVCFWRNPDGRWQSTLGEDGIGSINKVINMYGSISMTQEKALERAQSPKELLTILENTLPLVRASKNLFDCLQTAREQLMNDPEIIDIRDRAYQIHLNFELLYTDTQNTLSFFQVKKAEETAALNLQSAQTAHRLNIMVALFFPLTAFASVFGMNLKHGFEESPTELFWGVFLLMLIIGIALLYWVLRPFKDESS